MKPYILTLAALFGAEVVLTGANYSDLNHNFFLDQPGVYNDRVLLLNEATYQYWGATAYHFAFGNLTNYSPAFEIYADKEGDYNGIGEVYVNGSLYAGSITSTSHIQINGTAGVARLDFGQRTALRYSTSGSYTLLINPDNDFVGGTRISGPLKVDGKVTLSVPAGGISMGAFTAQ